jgi:hypothetical protein
MMSMLMSQSEVIRCRTSVKRKISDYKEDQHEQPLEKGLGGFLG